MTKALVTGATRAPGRVIAATLADAGWEVHALGRDRVVLEEMRANHGIVPMAMDLTDRDYVRFVVEGMEPDVLVHSALRWPDKARFLNLSEADIDMALEVNLSATIHLTRAVLPSMIARRQGALLMVSPEESGAASLIERTVASAVNGLAHALRSEISNTGVSVHYLAFENHTSQQLGEEALSLLSGSGFQPVPKP
ncbi:hypothetical protein AU381_19350 [Sinorhizobium glycinis]|uniref:Short-chain dehydrogenase n=1 Tax=Sinorhizobium glycinis TaxID=1472378 RepID=A0A178XN72_9HYPH|nr:SDR family oxidoreductase [Sinorhizobium glycinis]OAP36644.1 hypothetical protein AU381_19350 [Sinorhizobium glycinis]